MKISLNWLHDYLDTAPLRADLAGVLEKLTMRGLEVESIQDLTKGLANVVVAKVLTKEPHPNANKLSLCQVSDGTETLQIVCGAQNFKAGDKVALSKIGAHLPNGLKITASKIRDVESFGMLCSEVELGLATESPGIMIVDAGAELGTPIAKQLGRDDIVFEINVTPNRGDALSYIGVARELASILGQQIKLPQSSLKEGTVETSTRVQVQIEDATGCSQYYARILDNVAVKASPEWLKRRLESVGQRSINNIVDVTNYILLEWGTPLHAFDADLLKVEGGAKKTIHVRRARAGETIPLLDGTSVTLANDDLVIADDVQPIALAGVMGGSNSQVTNDTKTVLIEAAEFQSSSVRKSARRHQKHTEASQRFERQIDPRAVALAMERAAGLMVEVSGATASRGVVSSVTPQGEARLRGPVPVVVLSIKKLNSFLGLTLTAAEVKIALTSAGFQSKATSDADTVEVSLQTNRPDVSLIEDLYEEVLRTVGYDKVPSVVPSLRSMPAAEGVLEQRIKWIQALKTALAQMGFSECVNFAFTSEAKVNDWADTSDQTAGANVKLQNPLNEEFTTLKTSLFAGLFENLLSAWNYQQRDIRLFELRPVYFRDEKQETGVREDLRLAVMMTGRAGVSPLASLDQDLGFFDAKGILETLFDTLGARGFRYQDFGTQRDARFHPFQSVRISIGRGPCGVLGRIHPNRESAHKLRLPVYAFEFSVDRLLEILKAERKFTAISKFPKVTRDFSLVVPKQVSADKVLAAVQKLGKPLLESVSVVDVYEGDKIPEGMRSLSISTILADPSKTLADTEVDALSQKLLAGLDKELGVKLRLS